jgi:8-oxo-dGTP pyrophosphatase MutT (NUDIX family)
MGAEIITGPDARGSRRLRYRAWGLLPAPVRRWLVRRGTPAYTLGAVAVVEHDGRLLLVRLSYRRDWGLPGGLLDRREQPADAVRREAREEVGIDVEPLGAPTVVVDARLRRADVVFRCRLPRGTDPSSAAPQSGELLEVGWFGLDALPALQPEARAALEAVAHADQNR